ncbi:MAG TPA: FeoC-like transcriptional regulator [Tissierellaceae bacterium]|nr:FeoC-like transcriptional regulator [Tissierellaceae bacterium]
MLKDLLRTIKKTKSYSANLVARKMNISESMVEDMMKQLIRMGYIIEDKGVSHCETPCIKCPYMKTCNQNPATIYRISNKGEKLLH